MPFEILIVYAIGVFLMFHWTNKLITEDAKYTTDPFSALVSAVIVSLVWPVTLPLHVAGIIRRKLGLLIDFEKKRMK